MCLISCQSRLPSSPERTFPVELRSEQVQHAIIARQGEFTALALDATAFDTSFRSAPGVPVTLSVIEGPGEVAPGTAISDSAGHVRALYYALVTGTEARARIRAATPEDTLEFSVTILGEPAPSRLEFVAPPPILSIPSGSPSAYQLCARAFDAEDNPLLNQQIRFRVVAGAATIASVSPPDSHGVVTAELHHLGYDFTPLQIVAETVSSLDLRSLPPSLLRQFTALQLTPITASLNLPVKPVRSLQLSFVQSHYVQYRPQTPIKVSVQARYASGEAASGVKIRFESIPSGCVASPAAVTGANGMATTTIKLPPEFASAAVISTALDFGVSTSTVIETDDPATMRISATVLQLDPPTLEIHLQDKSGYDLARLPTRIIVNDKAGKTLLTGADGRVVHRLDSAPDSSEHLCVEVRPEGDRGAWLKFNVEPLQSDGSR